MVKKYEDFFQIGGRWAGNFCSVHLSGTETVQSNHSACSWNV